MADTEPSPEEALTKEEIQGTSEQPPATEKRKNACKATPPPTVALSLLHSHQKANAMQVTTLMTSRKKAAVSSSSSSPNNSRSYGGNPFKDRMGLGAYLDNPATFSASTVIAHDEDFVVIHDKFPKATVHTLILPRSHSVNLLHPFDALADPVLLAQVKAQLVKTKTLVAAELQRQLGRYSKSEAARQAVLDGEEDVADGGGEGELPKGRDWEAEVICGVHAVPSMSHLHVHVLSRDMHSAKLKHRKHYNSFNTPFLVDIDDFPLAEDDPRRRTKHAGYMQRDLQCWRCGENFGNKFTQFKDHLEVEFEEWKRE